MTRTVFFLVFSWLFVSPVTADNWGHWRGPSGNGVAIHATPPIEWSDTKNVKWKVAVPGRGAGSPVVWGRQVFVVTAVDVDKGEQQADSRDSKIRRADQRRSALLPGSDENATGALPKLEFKLLCYDRLTGDILWQRTTTVATPHEGTHSTNGFASASPCTDGQQVYAHFGSRGLYCFSMDGTLKWKRDDFGRMITRLRFGEGSSPTLEDGKIIVPWDHEGSSYLCTLDKSTGDTIWQTERDEPTCWATPLVVESNGKKQIIMNGENFARAYDLTTGKELWRCGGQTKRPVASPVAANGLVFIGSGFRGAFLGAFRLDGEGNIEGTEKVIWSVDRDTPDIASLLLSSGRIYFYKGKSGLLSCFDAATGRPHYMATRIPGLKSMIYASPIAAGGKIYLTDRRGTTVVIEDSDKLKFIATNSVGETVDATPAPVDSELFIRGEKHLFCISE